MESVKISEIIRLASNISLLVPLAFYLSRIKHLSREIHIIGALLFVSGASDLAGYILFNRQQSTVMLINSYYILMFFLLTWFYYRILLVRIQRRMVWVGVVVYLVSFIVVTLYVQPFTEYQNLMWLITAVVMILYSIAYFFHSVSAITTSVEAGVSLVWINVGVMLYFCLNLFLFVMANHVLTQLDPETSAMI